MGQSRNLNKILNKNGERGHTFLFPDFRGHGFNFYSPNIVLDIGLSYIAFFMLRYIASILYFFKAFIMKRC
jgi:pimeloyl-ACP methyl ester carboxylesterase